MPKFTDLPVATAAKDNDIVCIVDPDANISKQMTLRAFREHAFRRDILFGPAIQGLVLPSGGALQQITGYGSALPASPENDPVAGTMTIAGNTSGLVKVTMFIELDITNPSNQDNNLEVHLSKFDGAVTTDHLTNKLFTTSTTLDHASFNATVIEPASDGDVFSIKLASTLISQTVDILETTFIIEDI